LVAIGEKLKAAREKKNLSIEQVQKQTRIHSTVLRALEEGRCDEILTPTYVRGFLKKYSHHLGLNSNDILKEYSSLHPEESKQNIYLNKPEEKGSEILSKFIYVISIVLLFIVSLYLVTFLGNKAISAFKRPRAKKAEITSARRLKPLATPKVSLTSKPQASIPKKGPFTLVLKVKQPVKIQVKKDGVVLFNRVLPKGLVESFTADDKIELYVAKAEAIELVLDGRSLGSPGKGVIKNLEVTKKGIRIK
jgi:cytoskeletal protein RodZ